MCSAADRLAGQGGDGGGLRATSTVLESGLLAVTALENPYRARGGWPLILVLRTRPDRTLRLARHLAQMYPVKTVWVLDNNETFALVHPRDRDERTELTPRHLPIAADLLDPRTLPVLRAHTLAGPPQPPLLTGAQTRAIRHPYGDPSLEPGARLGAATHTSAATAQRRLHRLLLTGGAEIATVFDRCQGGLPSAHDPRLRQGLNRRA
ncbi:hypothetical protein Q5762_01420 [Streptomyces sp. P9(2023)]|uniref:hypothetical protein n=1 Tax=Streptomyces sp. P9(2023) TaxID=3064394 RepID=UPI0028F40482|nr:hypothetical protein [Streptomyces sp. P9(2023)]MDT9687027.1 hypothetical protein [Streptomyces sp. P9(2023)]